MGRGFDCDTGSPSTGGSFSPSVSVAASAIGDFLASSGNPLSFALSRTSTAHMFGCNNSCSVTFYGDESWSGQVILRYTYEVAEPATLALRGVGLVLAGARRRRRLA